MLTGNNEASKMALRGWRFIGVTTVICVYVCGILILSILNLQNPPQRRIRNGRYYTDSNLNHNELGGLLKRAPLKWCVELKFLGNNQSPPFAVKPVKHLETFPGHTIKNNREFILDIPERKFKFDDKFVDRSNKKNKLSDNDSEFIIETEPLNKKLKSLSNGGRLLDTTSPNNNEKVGMGAGTYLASFPGSGNTWLRYLLQQSTGAFSKITVLHQIVLTLINN